MSDETTVTLGPVIPGVGEEEDDEEDDDDDEGEEGIRESRFYPAVAQHFSGDVPCSRPVGDSMQEQAGGGEEGSGVGPAWVGGAGVARRGDSGGRHDTVRAVSLSWNYFYLLVCIYVC